MGENVTLIAARLKSSDTPNLTRIDNVTNALDLLNTENVNRNASFTHVTSTQLDDKGHGKFTFDPSQSGEYVFFLASGNETTSGLEVDNNNLSVTGEATIVGVEHALVHDRPSSAEWADAAAYRGDNLTFTLNESMPGDEVQHALLVYDRKTGFEDQIFILNVSGNPSNLSELAANTTLKHSIADVRGVSRVENDTTLVSRTKGTSPSVSQAFDFVASNTDREIPDNELLTDRGTGNGTLNASITVVSGDRSKIEVETLNDWMTSKYQWVHIATDETGEIRTKTGRFVLDSADFSVSNVRLDKNQITVGDSITATANVTNLGNEEATRTVNLKARPKGTSDWTTLVASEDITIAGGATEPVSLTGTLSSVGTYELMVNGRFAGEVEVKKKQTSGGGPPGSGGGPVEPPSVRVSFEQQTTCSVVANVQNGRAGTTVHVDVPRKQATCIPGVTFDSVDVTLANDNARFQLGLSSHADRPASVTSAPSGVAVKGYLQIDKTYISNSEIDTATVRFSVAPSQLRADGTPENVVSYRYHDGTWQELDTTFVGTQNGQYVYTAETRGFSVFAIGEKQPDISVSNAALERSTINVGDTVGVTADVTNDGSGQGTYTVELIVNGDVVDTTDVTVAAGETQTVTFSYTPDAAGEYEVAVNDVSAGTLTVLEDDETTTTTSDPADGTTTTTLSGPGEDPSDGPSGSLIALLILLLLGGAGGTLYYFREEVAASLGPYLRTVEEYLDPYLQKVVAAVKPYLDKVKDYRGTDEDPLDQYRKK